VHAAWKPGSYETHLLPLYLTSGLADRALLPSNGARPAGPACVSTLNGATIAEMERAMTGFHQDAEGHWVAELVCGHTQHVRHQPPFTLRPWVTTPEGRTGRLGQSLECPACDRKEMPAGYAPYQRTATFTQTSVPQGLLRQHQTKTGVWALVHVSSGSLEFWERSGSGETLQGVAAGQTATICPGVEHRVAPLGEVEFFVEFWRAAPAS